MTKKQKLKMPKLEKLDESTSRVLRPVVRREFLVDDEHVLDDSTVSAAICPSRGLVRVGLSISNGLTATSINVPVPAWGEDTVRAISNVRLALDKIQETCEWLFNTMLEEIKIQQAEHDQLLAEQEQIRQAKDDADQCECQSCDPPPPVLHPSF